MGCLRWAPGIQNVKKTNPPNWRRFRDPSACPQHGPVGGVCRPRSRFLLHVQRVSSGCSEGRQGAYGGHRRFLGPFRFLLLNAPH